MAAIFQALTLNSKAIFQSQDFVIDIHNFLLSCIFFFFLTQEKTESILVFENQSIRKGFFLNKRPKKALKDSVGLFSPFLLRDVPT